MKIITIIPARMGSSRFPGKPLADIHGLEMVNHCAKRAALCGDVMETYVATCDQEIVEAVERVGGKAVMTANTHERATDRAAEALLKIEEETGKADIVVMLQGDEPMVLPEMISAAIQPMLDDTSIQVVNLMAKMATEAEANDPNEVKVVVDKNHEALYFSREPIPSLKKYKGDFPRYKQVCIIPFQRDFLLEFNALPETPLEIVESVDMMRVLEHGKKVKMVETTCESYSVDTEEDLARVRAAMSADPLFNRYLN